MSRKLFLAALVVTAAVSAPAAAADFSFTGNLAGADDVAFFDFTLDSTSTVTLRTYSYAGGVNAAGATIARGGFDPILALFNKSSGALIGQNDDGGSLVPADPNTGNQYDTYFSQSLAAGTYTVSISAFSNFAIGPNLSNGFSGGGNFMGRESRWAFDVLGANVATGPGGVPEPATWAMLIAGFGLAGAAIRGQHRAKVAFA
jgi:hypothetical protein